MAEVGKVSRTLDQCREEILDYFKETGKRPTSRIPVFRKWSSWLRGQGSSLVKECSALGLPDIDEYHRTLEQCHEAIKEYRRTTGKTPGTRSGPPFNTWDSWLYKRGSSLAKECKKLGLPVSKDFGRSFETCRREILDFYNKNGKTPSHNNLSACGGWLKNHNSSLPQECRKLGLPVLNNLRRTLEQCHKDLWGYYRKTMVRPTGRTPGFQAWGSWLYTHGTTLSRECDRLGFPRPPSYPERAL